MTQSKPHRIRGQEETIKLDNTIAVGCWIEQVRAKGYKLRSTGE